MLFRIRLQSNAVAGLRRSVLLLAGAFGLSTCGPGHEADCLKSNGAPTTQRRPVDRRVRSVVVYDNVDLIIVPDTATYAEVTAGEHVIDQLTLTYRDSQTLLLNNTSRCNFVRSYDTPREVRLHTPRLTNLEQRGYGTISTASRWTQDTLFVHLVAAGDVKLDLTSTYLLTDMYELGDMTLSGTAEDFQPVVGGTGFLFAGGLQARFCYFRTTRTSLGDAHVRATQNLGGTLDGKGTFYYAGNPRFIDVKGSGKLVKE
jgi:hypothetical protein